MRSTATSSADFLLQNSWMARAKPGAQLEGARTNWAIFALHVLLAGGLPALFAGWGWTAWGASLGVHAIIDGFRLGRRWAAFYRQPVNAYQPFLADQAFHWFSLWLVWRFVA